MCVCVCVCLATQSCPTLCDPMNWNLTGSSVHGLFQARIVEWVAISYSTGSSQTRNWTHVSSIGRWILYHCATWEAQSYILYIYIYLVTQTVKNLPVMQETGLNPWVGKIPWRREWLPIPVFLPRESHGQGSLVGYSPWSCKVRHDSATFTFHIYIFHLNHF